MINSVEKENRYDRQLRLWGDNGQKALEAAHICLIGANALGAEILKNLVLPGLGSFTIIDDSVVSKSDLGSNFFVTVDALNKPRAEIVTESLLELNPNVDGIPIKPEQLIHENPNFFKKFSLIICTNAKESFLLSQNCIINNKPLVLVYTVGFIGFLKLIFTEHTIIESHPDSTLPDVRLDMPLPILDSMSQTLNSNILNRDIYSKNNSKELSHIPWIIILHQMLKKYAEVNNGKFPSNSKDKKDFRKMVSDQATLLIDFFNSSCEDKDRFYTLENFEEAKTAINTAIRVTTLPDNIKMLFDDPKCKKEFNGRNKALKLDQDPFVFWQMVYALKNFVEEEGGGYLPLRGSLPDMTADTKRYLELQRAYCERSEWAVQKIFARLSHVPDIDEDIVRLFVKNSYFLNVVRCECLPDEISRERSEELKLFPGHIENEGIIWYILLKASVLFMVEHGRWPGQKLNAESVENDLIPLRSTLNKILRASNLSNECIGNDHLLEIIRAGGSEIHSIAAYLGGVTSQEVIKLITHQFVPISKPLIYDGIRQSISLVDI